MASTPEIPAGQARVINNNSAQRKGNIIVSWITSTDHKTIGYMYLIASFLFFCIGGVMALIIRAQLFEPGLNLLETKEQYNQLFTMHGTIMLLMFATPLFAGFANALMPLQIGAPDVAFPRLNAFAFWLFLFGSLLAVGGFLTPQGAASFGWFAYAATVEHDVLARNRRKPLGSRTRALRIRNDPRWRELHHHDHHDACARHDDVPDADLHLEHPRHVTARSDGVPGPRGSALRPRCRPRLRRPHL